MNRSDTQPKTIVIYILGHSIMLFLLLAALSALETPTPTPSFSSFALCSRLLLFVVHPTVLLSLSFVNVCTVAVLFPELAAPTLFIPPLPVLLCTPGTPPFDLGASSATDECRLPLRDPLEGSGRTWEEPLESVAGDDAVKSKIARSSVGSRFTAGTFVSLLTGCNLDAVSSEIALVDVPIFRFVVLVSSIIADIA